MTQKKDNSTKADRKEIFSSGPDGLRQLGKSEGRQEAELAILRRQIEKRFGNLPGWASDKLSSLPASELEDLV